METREWYFQMFTSCWYLSDVWRRPRSPMAVCSFGFQSFLTALIDVHEKLRSAYAIEKKTFTTKVIRYSGYLQLYRTLAETDGHSSPVADPGFGQGRGQPAKEGPQALAAPQAVIGPSRFEHQRGPFEASDAQRTHYELRRPLRAAQKTSTDAQRAPL